MRFALLPPHFCHRIFATAHLPPHIALPLPPRFAAQVSPTSFPNCTLRSALCSLRSLRCAQGVPFSESAPQTPRRSRSVACRSSAPCFRAAVHGRPTQRPIHGNRAQRNRAGAALHFCAARECPADSPPPPRIYSTVYSRVAHNGQPAFYGYSLRVPISECADISL